MSETLSGSFEREAMLKHLEQRIAELKKVPAVPGDTVWLYARVDEIGKMIEFINRRQEMAKAELAGQEVK